MAGEVAQVAQAAQAAQTSWVALVASSAVIGGVAGAAINTISNWCLKLFDYWRESRLAKRRVDHVKLDIMDQLETFANRCASRMGDIADGFDEFYNLRDSSFARANKSKFPLAFDPEPRWEELPVSFVAPIKAMQREYEEANQWILRQFDWADISDLYEFELERVAFYGMRSLDIAARIRQEINAGAAGLTLIESAKKDFEDLIKQRRAGYAERGEHGTLIPELHALFDAEMPEVKLRKKPIEPPPVTVPMQSAPSD
jgi:hypothetical protein